MTNKIYFEFEDYCPFLDDFHEIQIISAEMMLSGHKYPSYKKLQFKCEHSNECSKKLKKCPVYSKAPSSI